MVLFWDKEQIWLFVHSYVRNAQLAQQGPAFFGFSTSLKWNFLRKLKVFGYFLGLPDFFKETRFVLKEFCVCFGISSFLFTLLLSGFYAWKMGNGERRVVLYLSF